MKKTIHYAIISLQKTGIGLLPLQDNPQIPAKDPREDLNTGDGMAEMLQR